MVWWREAGSRFRASWLLTLLVLRRGRAIVADDTVAGACSPQSGGPSVVDDEDRGDCCTAAFPRSPREDVQTLDGFLDRSSGRASGAGRRPEAGRVEGSVRCHGGAAAKGHCRLSALRSPACQHAVVAREDYWTDRLELRPSGARAIDVGHCRRYLAALYSPEWSEQLRSLYESIAGVSLDPWWDLYALLHYDDSGSKWIRGQVAGRRPVDVAGMTSRVEVAVETALRRLG